MKSLLNQSERKIVMKRFCLIALMLVMDVNSVLLAHEGEEHGDTNKVKIEEGMFVLTGATDNFEVVLKYPPTSIGKEMSLLIYLSDYATNKPISNASIEFDITGLDTLKPKIEKTDLAGVYHAELILPDNKPYDVLFTITSDGIVDLIPIHGIQVGLPLQRSESDSHPHIPEFSLIGKLFLGGLALLLFGAIAFIFYTLGRRSKVRSRVDDTTMTHEIPKQRESKIKQQAIQ